MTRRRLAVLHHTDSFFAPDLREALGDSVELVWMFRSDKRSDDDGLRRWLARRSPVVEIDAADPEAAARTLAAHVPEGIVTFVDDNLIVAAEIAARLGLPFHSREVARTVTSKILSREAFARAGVPGPRFWAVPAGLSEAELGRRAAAIVDPAVLKAAEGSGSRGILALEGPRALQAAYRPETAFVVEEQPSRRSCAGELLRELPLGREHRQRRRLRSPRGVRTPPARAAVPRDGQRASRRRPAGA